MADTLTHPYTFSSGGAIRSAEMNANFSACRDIVNGKISSDNLKDGAVTASKIANGAVTESKIGTGAITSGKIGANAIGTTEINANAVTFPKIAANNIFGYHIYDGTITGVDIAPNGITNTNMANDSITSANIATGSIFGYHVYDKTLNAADISDLGILEDNLASGCVTNTKIADNAVTETKIANGSITNSKFASSIADILTVKKYDIPLGYVDVQGKDYQAVPLTQLASGETPISISVIAYDDTNEVWGYEVPPVNSFKWYPLADAGSASSTGEVILNGYSFYKDNSTGFWTLGFPGENINTGQFDSVYLFVTYAKGSTSWGFLRSKYAYVKARVLTY
jgi:hypothetical protein